MATRINRTVSIDGIKRWIRANSEQEYAEKILGLISERTSNKGKHAFRTYALNWFDTYARPNIATVTAETYKRQLTLYLLPHFGDMMLEDITIDDVQRLFNGITGSRATKIKVKQVLNMILETALEDGYISKNPLTSKRIKIVGAASKTTPPYTVEQMRFLIRNLDKVKNPSDRMYLALHALHPLRLEEVLGLQWQDIDFAGMTIHIQRAVTHPTRNQPEIRPPKTESSNRVIGLSQITARYLTAGAPGDFVLGGSRPFSYTQVRKMCDRIKADTGFDENITPIRFRTTVLTDIYAQTKDVKETQAAAGHTTSAMTFKYYVKGRDRTTKTAAAIDQAYGMYGM